MVSNYACIKTMQEGHCCGNRHNNPPFDATVLAGDWPGMAQGDLNFGITSQVGTSVQSACHAPTIRPTNKYTCVLDEVIKSQVLRRTIFEFNLT